ncbi:MAG: hypothetical protein ACE5HU_01580 [Acidobacteriota bacterium]
MLIGVLLALVGRSVGLPAASGALVAGLGLAWSTGGSILSSGSSAQDGLVLLRLIFLAFLCLLLGAEIDLASLVKLRLSLATTTLAHAAGVTGAVFLAGTLIGLSRPEAILLGAAAVAASPAALIAVSSEARARGEATQRVLIIGSLSLAIGLVGVTLAGMLAGGSAPIQLPGLAVSLGAGIACGVLLLIPLSAMATRGAILTCLACGAFALAGLSRGIGSERPLALMAIVAGAILGSFASRREPLREALRDLAFPSAVGYFALTGSLVAPDGLAGALAAAAVVVTARTLGLIVAGVATRGTHDGFPEAVALTPMAGYSLVAPLFSNPSSTDPALWDRLVTPLLAAALISEFGGMIAFRNILARAGWMPAASTDPRAWRRSMR